MNPDSLCCPKCHSTSGFRNLEMEGSGTGFGIFVLGGLLPWLMYSSSQKSKAVCTHCGYAFTPHSILPANKLLWIAVFSFLAALLLTAWNFLFGS